MYFSLLNSTLPLFGLVLIGFLLGKFSIFEKLEANVLTKIVGVTVLPALGIKIFSNFNYEFFNFYLYFNYFFIQFLIYLSGFLVSKFYFLRSFSESIIIGMACGFSNHIFFVYPIAISEFPTKDLVPIETIIAFDFINVAMSILALDFANNKNLGKRRLFLKQLKNPALIGLFLGLIILISDLYIPFSINKLVNFICNLGVPCTLIAMGILLSFKTDITQIKLSFLIIILKMFVFPLLMFIIIYFSEIDFTVARTTIMVSSAPLASMPLIFAAIYKVKTDAVVRAGLFTYLIALLSVPFVGGII